MAIRINAEALGYAYELSGSMDNIQVDAEALDYNYYYKGVYTSFPAAQRNPDLDQTFNCLDSDRFGVYDQGILRYTYEISGDWLNKAGVSDFLDYAYEISAAYVISKVFAEGTIDYAYELDSDFYYEMDKISWVKWSDIGHLNFDVTQSNQAGERPMEWTGLIYDILKFNDGVIVYGVNGIAEMKPVKNTWSYRTVYSIGTKGRDSQVSNKTNTIHWFVDVLGQLWEISNSITKLDYSEFLSILINPVMSINEQDNLIYLCDGTNGYVYNYADKSLSKGYPNITGYGYKNATVYVVSPAAIVVPDIAFTTNTYDMGTRKEKNIYQMEISTETPEEMEVAINYRTRNDEDFTITPWIQFTPRGIAYLPCYGIEFQFKFRLANYDILDLDQFKINGQIHGFSFLDVVRRDN